MDYIRWSKSQSGHDGNTRHCLYGLDADLVGLYFVQHLYGDIYMSTIVYIAMVYLHFRGDGAIDSEFVVQESNGRVRFLHTQQRKFFSDI